METVVDVTLVWYYEPLLTNLPKVGILRGSASEGWILKGSQLGRESATPMNFPFLSFVIAGEHRNVSHFTQMRKDLGTDIPTLLKQIRLACIQNRDKDDDDNDEWQSTQWGNYQPRLW